MQTKGKKKIIDNAGALQKKYAWKSEKTQDTKKAPQDTKKQAAVCPYAKKCGGCDYQGMSYEQQLQEKQTYVRKNIGDYCKVLPIIGMENPYHYRNKVHAVFDVERRGKHANGGRRTAGNGHAKAAPGGVISGVPAAVFNPLKTLSKFFIVLAMSAIGLNTNIVKLVKTAVCR
jgi:23S rRNA (uracil1939-C5)-methyltransferase